MSEDVKRWQSGEYEMIEDSDGLWVWGEDYDAQATEIERLTAELSDACKLIDDLTTGLTMDPLPTREEMERLAALAPPTPRDEGESGG